jgi:hypothetical protein
MGKNPAFQFYPADWLTDHVAGCSLSAQGLWLRMMMQMHFSDRYGYLNSGDAPKPSELIARQAGVSLDEYKANLAELDAAGVPRRTSKGIIYSKRMVEDEAKRGEWRQRQQKHRDTPTPVTPSSRERHANVTPSVTPLSRLSSSSSSSSSSPLNSKPGATHTNFYNREKKLEASTRESHLGEGPSDQQNLGGFKFQPCPHCGKDFTTGGLRLHQPKCPSKPAKEG